MLASFVGRPASAAAHVSSFVTCAPSAGANSGFFGLFAKYGQPPGWRYGQWDFRPRWDFYTGRTQDLEVSFDARQPGWQLGLRPPTPLVSALELDFRSWLTCKTHCNTAITGGPGV